MKQAAADFGTCLGGRNPYNAALLPLPVVIQAIWTDFSLIFLKSGRFHAWRAAEWGV